MPTIIRCGDTDAAGREHRRDDQDDGCAFELTTEKILDSMERVLEDPAMMRADELLMQSPAYRKGWRHVEEC